MQKFKSTIFYLRVVSDSFILVISFVVTNCIIYKHFSIILSKRDFLILLLLFFVWYIAAAKNYLYDEFRSRNFSYEAILVIKTVFYQLLFTVIIIYLLDDKSMPRRFIFYYNIILVVFILIEKYLLRVLLNKIRLKGRNLRSLLIIGAGEVGLGFYNTINENPHFGYKILGFLDDKMPYHLNGEYLGPISGLKSLLDKIQIDDVIIALPNYASQKIEEIIKICENHTTRVRIIPDYFRFVSKKYNVAMFGNFPLINIREDNINEFHNRLIKRIFDILFSITVIVFILSWLMPLITLFIKLTSKGPIFFKQERWGRNNRKFIAYKFRTMTAQSSDLDEKGKFQQARKDDPRVTKIGKILRKTNLDELPQFFNVLKGEMSVVAPRPHPTPLNLESKNFVSKYMQRHLVKPGITGWAQVNGYRGETREIHLMQKRIDYDLWYIENWSFWLDIQIIIMTILKMIKGDPNAY